MIVRLWHRIFGHSPVLHVTEVRPNPAADPDAFRTAPHLWPLAFFGGVTIMLRCRCGIGAQNVILGRVIGGEEQAKYQKEIDELRRLANL